jgi:hypothetical protein
MPFLHIDAHERNRLPRRLRQYGSGQKKPADGERTGGDNQLVRSLVLHLFLPVRKLKSEAQK